MLEEKSKIVEMMNEANNLFDNASRAKSATMADPNLGNDFMQRQAAVGSTMDDLSNIIKP